MKTHRTLMLLPLAFLLTGCVNKAVEDSAVTCTYQWWVSPAVLLLGIAGTVWGWHSRSSGWRSILFMVMAGAVTVGFAPFGWIDYVRISKERLETKWGFWIAPTTHSIAWSDVGHVDLVSRTSRKRRGGTKTSYYLQFRLKSGQMEELTLGNSLMEEAAEDIVATLATRGIAVNDLTGE